MTTATTVAFSKLIASDAINARAAGKDGIDELAQSIAQRGLIQPLAVRPAADNPDRYEVIDGRRRFLAMQRLVKARSAGWSKASKVPVLVRNEDDTDALETSLVANTVRLPMHPVDQHDVFSRLVAQGVGETDIAGRFGLSARQVKQQLALARLAPAVREAWRKGKLTAAAAQAFTLQPDHSAQEAAFKRLDKSYGRSGGPTDYVVRQELAQDRPRAGDVPDAVLERYTHAGGTLTEDLFSDERYVEDGALLDRCEREWKAEIAADFTARLTGQGWAWVALADELPISWRWQWDTVRPRHARFEMTPEQEQKHDDLLADFEEAESAGDEPEAQRREAIADAYLADCEAQSYSADERQVSGVVIVVKDDGSTECAFGVIRPDQSAVEQNDDGADDDGDEDLPSVSSVLSSGHDQDAGHAADDAEDSPAISFALRQTLGEAQTRAVAAIVTNDSELALRLAVAALCTTSTDSPVKLSIDREAHDRPPTDQDFARKLAAVATLSYGEVIQKFTSFVARALQLTPVFKTENPAAALLPILDPAKYATWMRESFLAEDYFKRAPKSATLAALEEMRAADCGGVLAPAADLADLKKSELAVIATSRAQQSGWLPPELRHPAYRLAPSAQREAA